MGQFRLARNPSEIDAKRGDHFLQADFSGSIRVSPEGNLEFANHLLGTSVRLQVEHKQLIGNGHLIGSSLR